MTDSMTGGIKDSMKDGMTDSMTGGMKDSMKDSIKDSMKDGIKDNMKDGMTSSMMQRGSTRNNYRLCMIDGLSAPHSHIIWAESELWMAWHKYMVEGI